MPDSVIKNTKNVAQLITKSVRKFRNLSQCQGTGITQWLTMEMSNFLKQCTLYNVQVYK